MSVANTMWCLMVLLYIRLILIAGIYTKYLWGEFYDLNGWIHAKARDIISKTLLLLYFFIYTPIILYLKSNIKLIYRYYTEALKRNSFFFFEFYLCENFWIQKWWFIIYSNLKNTEVIFMYVIWNYDCMGFFFSLKSLGKIRIEVFFII